MDPTMDPNMAPLLLALLQQQGGAAAAGYGTPGATPSPMPGAMPGMGPGPGGTAFDLGAMLRGQSPAGTAPTFSGNSPTPPPPDNQTGYMGVNPMAGVALGGAPPGMPGGLPGGLPGTTVAPFSTSTQSPGATGGVTPGIPGVPGGGGVPSTAAQAAGNPLAGLAAFKAPPTPQPIMPHAGPGSPQAIHPMVPGHAATAMAQLLNAIMGARGAQPLFTPPGGRFG